MNLMELDDLIEDVGAKRLCYKDVVDLFYLWKKETTQKPTLLVDYSNKKEKIIKLELKPEATNKKEKKGNLKTQENGEKRFPRYWTSEEVDAIEEGIKRFGVGHWAPIHKEFIEIFTKNNRSPADIRLKWRTMSKHVRYHYLLQKENSSLQ